MGAQRRPGLPPEVEAMLRVLDAFPDVTGYEPAELRALIRSRRGPLRNTPAMWICEDRVIEGPGGDLALRILVPHHEQRGPVPVVVFAHGGGFVFCDLDSHDELCRAMAEAVGAVVISVDYRLAPEHPGPAAMEDVYAALIWASEHAAEYGADPGRIAVAGDSAGGNLAATVCLAARDRGGPRIAAQVLLYPVIDDDFDTESYRRYGVGYYNTAKAMRWYWQQYAPDGTDDPYLVPTRAATLAGLPPAVIVTAELDPPCSAGDDYARRLSAAGVPVLAHRFDGLFHGFLTFPDLSLTGPARQRLWQMMREVLAGSVPSARPGAEPTAAQPVSRQPEVDSLRRGDAVTRTAGAPREGAEVAPLTGIDRINGLSPEKACCRTHFADLTSCPNEAEMRTVLGHFATGVVAITAADSETGQPVGLAANSFTSVSLDPPLIAFCVAATSTSWPRVRSAGRYAISILSDAQEAVCRRLATRGVDKFDGIDWAPSPSGAPVVTDCLAWIEAELEAEYPAGDHTIVVSRVRHLYSSDLAPLIFFRGRYGRLSVS